MKKYRMEELMEEYFNAFGNDGKDVNSNGIAFLFNKIVELTNEIKDLKSCK